MSNPDGAPQPDVMPLVELPQGSVDHLSPAVENAHRWRRQVWPFIFAGLVAPMVVGALDLAVLFALNGGRGGSTKLWGMFAKAWLAYGYFGILIALPAALLVGYPLYLVGIRVGIASPAMIVASAGVVGAGLLWWSDQGTARTTIVGAVAGVLTGALLVRLLRRPRRGHITLGGS